MNIFVVMFISFGLMAIFFYLMGFYLLVLNNFYILEYSISGGMLSFSGSLVFDWVGTIFLGTILFISSMVMLYSTEYMEGDLFPKRFCYLVLLFILSMGVLVLSPNLFFMLLGWDGLGLISYCLVIYYQNFKSFNAGMLTVLSNRVGDLGMLLGIVIFFNFGGWNFLGNCFNEKDLLMFWLMGALFLASLTKSAQIPFSAWLPAAMAAPTPISSLVHSSTLVTAGVFLLIRFNWLLDNVLLANILCILSLLTLLVGGVGACFEMDLKKMVAMSTMSQMGLIMFVLSLGLWEVAYFHMLTHAIFKATLFLCVGSLIHALGGGQDIRFMGGLISFCPLVGVGFMFSVLSLCGIPFSCGYYSKDLLIEMYLMGDKSVMMCMFFFLGVLLTAVYSARLLFYSFLGSGGVGVFVSVGEFKNMSISIFLMGWVGVFFGGCGFWLLIDSKEMILMSIGMKMAMLILVGVLFFLSNIYMLGESVLLFKQKIFSEILSSIWFLSMVSSWPFLKIFSMVGNEVNKGDSLWLEMFLGSGLWGVLQKISLFIQRFQNNFFFSQMVLFFFILLWLFILS